jgi:hypothetical protein
MSGGSFNYLCHKGADEIFSQLHELKEMVTYCREHNKQEIANELDRLYVDLNSFRNATNVRLKRLYHLLRSVEWERSGDSCWEYAEEEYQKLFSPNNQGEKAREE